MSVGAREGHGEDTVLTNGYECYIRLRRGIYAPVDRRGRTKGGIASGFQPRPRWKPARRCAFVIPEHGLTCPNCGAYDTGYATTGVRSYCLNQGKGWDRG